MVGRKVLMHDASALYQHHTFDSRLTLESLESLNSDVYSDSVYMINAWTLSGCLLLELVVCTTMLYMISYIL